MRFGRPGADGTIPVRYTDSMLKAVVFDFDGVIVDSEPLHFRAFVRVAESIGVTFDYDHYVQHLIGYDDRDVCRLLLARSTGAGGDAGPDKCSVDEDHVCALKDRKGKLFEQIVGDGVAAIPGATRLIETASSQMPIAISSGATRADIDLILDALGLIGRFDPIVSADDVARSKPDPESYRQAVAGVAAGNPHLRLEPGDCLAIEDTTAGIESARGAGLWTLGLTTSGPAERLTRAHRIAESLEELTIERLQQWFG